MTWPVGAHACECAGCHRGFVSTEAFDRHRRHGRVCLEPSSIGMWLATDGQWSMESRSPAAERAAQLEQIANMNARKAARQAPG